ncbi:MAG: glutathione S-transferase C-terminal domain-containing protein [Magnetococcales bacterium]|nr:glutathione S-transferase C-terminal domain-containing protein [Magnetococcales bacterium]
MLIKGVWSEPWHPYQGDNQDGDFRRQPATVRNWITPDGQAGPTGVNEFAAEPGRYRLYVSLLCPWACRTLMARQWLGLSKVIKVTILDPVMGLQGWRFTSVDPDPVMGAHYLHQLYTRNDPRFTGRSTVPVLWDDARDIMVNNESADILRMLDSAFAPWSRPDATLRPEGLSTAIDDLNASLYNKFNNGVYRAGFARNQTAYEEAVADVFALLDNLEQRILDNGPYLFGATFTESDIRLFVTLARFDAAYHGLFKCNRRRIADYPALTVYLRRIYALPGIAETVNLDHIKAGYYGLKSLNPNGIIPTGPDDPFVAA